MTKIILDIGDRKDGECCDNHVYYGENKCPYLRGGGSGIYFCGLNGNWVDKYGGKLPQRSLFCLRSEMI
jgi:hypothetical protein